MSDGGRNRCPLCSGSGVVGIFAHKSVKAVEHGRAIRCAYAAGVVCECAAGAGRYGSVQIDGQPIGGYFAQGFCRLPNPFYRPTPSTIAADVAWMQAWLDGRGTARVGEFTVDDWRG